MRTGESHCEQMSAAPTPSNPHSSLMMKRYSSSGCSAAMATERNASGQTGEHRAIV